MSVPLDMTGLRFGKLVVTAPAEPKRYGRAGKLMSRWHCQCDCGRTTVVMRGSLIRKNHPQRACGCMYRREMVGQMFGRLKVLSKDLDSIRNGTHWTCRCVCGKTISALGTNLRRGHTTSCGCFQTENLSAIKTINITNQRFGRLIALARVPAPVGLRSKLAFWLCRCQCGNDVIVRGTYLRTGWTKSCGCISEMTAGKTFASPDGLKFGRLTVLDEWIKDKFFEVKWKCRCDCGSHLWVTLNNLRTRRIESCRCLGVDKTRFATTTHGKTKSAEYRVWWGMKSRCYNDKTDSYENYGGRGIEVCDRWMEAFEHFYEDMGPRPSSLHSIDRINNNGNYEPDNCRWATAKEQANNRRKPRRLVAEALAELAPLLEGVDGSDESLEKLSLAWSDLKKRLPRLKKDIAAIS